ncbi:hypothetical protein HWV62_18356 [Athelia sp. TMB]|nr:hypothetical protein HWV62_18356 [Athelia sp. TMB]
MPLFDVPGWSVPAAAPTSSSNKRKRPSSSTNSNSDLGAGLGRIKSAEMNLDKLMHKLRGDKEEGAGPRTGKKRKRSGTNASLADLVEGPSLAKRKEEQTLPKEKGREKDKAAKKPKRGAPELAAISGPKKLQSKKEREARARERKEQEAAAAAVSNASLATSNHTLVQSTPSPPKSSFNFSFKSPGAATDEGDKKGKGKESGLTALQKGMKASLDGARFRWINEVLYKADSAESHEMMRNDPAVYEEYHTGFRHQVLSWPTNPVTHYTSILAAYPSKTVIADLGCGDAALARALLPAKMTVLSFDLVSDGKLVVEADICAHVPLPGSEAAQADEKGKSKTQGEGGVVDVVVCALSLMGTNWPGTIREAWRILLADGELKIAEVTSRFTDVDAFVSLVGSIGFRLVSKDEENTHFTLFEFVKVPRKPISQKEWEGLLGQGNVLKACEYKRR